jgi:predicted amino acid racemase
VAVADTLDAMEGARFSGITTFPATLFDSATNTVATTPNLETLQKAAAMLRKAGRSDIEVNAPGTTSTALLARLAEAGATQIEPGHGLTGTTPWHAVEDLVEEPAIAYISEVSHVWNDSAYVFGGGLYVDPVLGNASTSAMIVTDPDAGIRDTRPLPVDMPALGAIDYYASIPLGDTQGVRVGNTVIFGFRAQVFVTRAQTVGISGLSVGIPRLHGLWMSDGSAPLTLGEAALAGSTALDKEKTS